MKQKLLTCFICTIMLMTINTLKGQNRSFKVKGTIIESTQKKSVEFATIMLIDPDNQEALAGGTSEKDGSFLIESPSDNFHIQISFIIRVYVVLNGNDCVDLTLIFVKARLKIFKLCCVKCHLQLER